MSIAKSCTALIPDCNIDQMPVGSSCYGFNYDAVPDGATVFTAHNQYGIYGSPISTDNLTLQSCALKCRQNDDCKAIEFGISSTENRPDLWNTGTCKLYNNYVNVPSPPQGKPDTCTTLYYKTVGDNDIVSISSGGKNLNIDLSNNKPADEVPTIESDYGGSTCRKEVVDGAYAGEEDQPLLQNMADWCKSHQDFAVCNEFCNNELYKDYCTWIDKPGKHFYLYLILWFVFLFVFIMVLVRTEDKKKKRFITISGIIILIVIGILVIQNIYQIFSNKPKTGGKSDFPSWNWRSHTGKPLPPCTVSCSNGGANCGEFMGGCFCQGNSLLYGQGYYLEATGQANDWTGGVNTSKGYTPKGKLGAISSNFWMDIGTTPVTFQFLTVDQKDDIRPIFEGDIVYIKLNGKFISTGGNVIDTNACQTIVKEVCGISQRVLYYNDVPEKFIIHQWTGDTVTCNECGEGDNYPQCCVKYYVMENKKSETPLDLSKPFWIQRETDLSPACYANYNAGTKQTYITFSNEWDIFDFKEVNYPKNTLCPILCNSNAMSMIIADKTGKTSPGVFTFLATPAK